MMADDLVQQAVQTVARRHYLIPAVWNGPIDWDVCSCGENADCPYLILLTALADEHEALTQADDLLARAREHFIVRHGIDCGFLMSSPSPPDDTVHTSA